VVRQARILFGLVLFLVLVGILGFVFIEGWPLLDAFYMTVITITTVGYGEVQALSQAGQLFTTMLIIGGVTLWAYGLSSLVRLFAEGDLRQFFSQRRVEKMIGSTKNHFIVCGFGRIGSLVCQQLAEEKIPFVAVDKKTSHFDKIDKTKFLYIAGDGTQEKVLLDAGIKRARCLISYLGSDAGNVYTVLTARHLNPDIYIVCRSEDEEAEDKILKAGANKVISPYQIGGRTLASAGMHPNMRDFIELLTSKNELALTIEEVPVPMGSSIVGQTLMESKIRERFGAIVVACRTVNNETVFNPSASYVVKGGDVFIALGKPECFLELHRDIG